MLVLITSIPRDAQYFAMRWGRAGLPPPPPLATLLVCAKSNISLYVYFKLSCFMTLQTNRFPRLRTVLVKQG